jgi:hypothetical protein
VKFLTGSKRFSLWLEVSRSGFRLGAGFRFEVLEGFAPYPIFHSRLSGKGEQERTTLASALQELGFEVSGVGFRVRAGLGPIL